MLVCVLQAARAVVYHLSGFMGVLVTAVPILKILTLLLMHARSHLNQVSFVLMVLRIVVVLEFLSFQSLLVGIGWFSRLY